MPKINAENDRVKEILAQLPTKEQVEAKARFFGLLAQNQLRGM